MLLPFLYLWWFLPFLKRGWVPLLAFFITWMQYIPRIELHILIPLGHQHGSQTYNPFTLSSSGGISTHENSMQLIGALIHWVIWVRRFIWAGLALSLTGLLGLISFVILPTPTHRQYISGLSSLSLGCMALSNEQQVTIILFYFVYVVILTFCLSTMSLRNTNPTVLHVINVFRSYGKYFVLGLKDLYASWQ